jgi:hypothetical protein
MRHAMKCIDVLLTLSAPKPSAANLAALEPLLARVRAAQTRLDAARAEFSALVEDLAACDIRKLQRRVVPAHFPRAARAVTLAAEIRGMLDRTTFVELVDAGRAAKGAVNTFEYDGAYRTLREGLARAENNLGHLDARVAELLRLLNELEPDAESMVSDATVVQPPAPHGWLK